MSGALRIAVASGKGETGKTTVATNSAVVLAKSGARSAYVDCDVEEPNGYPFLRPSLHTTRGVSIPISEVDEARRTDRWEELRRIAAIVERFRPTRVQLNTVSRPPAEACALATPREFLESLPQLFSVPCEVIAKPPSMPPTVAAESSEIEDEIVALLKRRPCTVEGIAVGLGLRPNEVLKHLEALCARGSIRSE